MSFFFNSRLADAYITVLPHRRTSSVRRRLLTAIVWFVFLCGFIVWFGGDFAADDSLVNMGDCWGSVVSVVGACCFTSLFTGCGFADCLGRARGERKRYMHAHQKRVF